MLSDYLIYMASINGEPKPPSTNEVKGLVEALENASKLTSRGRAFKRIFELYESDKKLVSWKFQEWDYGKNNLSLPCNARGLFILDDMENPEIVARGYDKFFNIDEVSNTKWDWIEENTLGPYEVTLKSNGCIIFISGMSDGTLVVCSKHSTGPRADVDRNHAECGKAYLSNQLKEKNVDVKQFAKTLYDLNVTAVAEYCDDSFEEHILEYTGDKVGLYLHGINLNQREFVTWPMDSVNNFACQYGFKPTLCLKKNDMTTLKSFLEECSLRGSYKHMEVEGFVIRCHLRDNGKDFFFKYKFEEPYLMYRQWREVTKDYITTRSRVFKFRKHKFVTNKYLDFVIPLLDGNPKLCEDYLKGFGIIKLRNMFLESYGMSGMEILNHEKIRELELRNAIDFEKVDERTKFLIFPIAVIGCGKTTTSLTLTNLYPKSWGIIQNDDIKAKDKSMLMKRSLELLAKPEIKCVIVDRNNHQYRERKQLFDWLEDLKEDYLPYDTNIKVIGLSFFPYEDMQTIKELTIERVLARGDNHQSIKSCLYGEKKILGIMNGFMRRYQPVDENKMPDSMFDLMIYLRVLQKDSSLINAGQIIKKIHDNYPVLISEMPSEVSLKLAFEKSLEYKPTVVKIVKNGSDSSDSREEGLVKMQSKKRLKPAFFSANVREPARIIREIVRTLKTSELNPNDRADIERLIVEDRFQTEFHITLSHVVQGKNGTSRQKEVWKEFISHYQSILSKVQNESDIPSAIKTNDVVNYRLKKLCWDDKIVSIIVQLDDECVIDCKGQVVPKLGCSNELAHITIGILKDDVRPSYSNELCSKVMGGVALDSVQCLDMGVFDQNGAATFEADVYINL